MEYIIITEGLGNQMFQYAFYRARIANGKDIRIIFDLPENPSSSNIKIFSKAKLNKSKNIILSYAIRKTGKKAICSKIIYGVLGKIGKLYVEQEDCDTDSVINDIEGKVLSGYFQHQEYFRNVQNEIRETFTFPEGEKKLKSYINNLSRQENTVSIHIRRGDYLKFPEIYGGICTEKYYKNAMNLIEKHISPHYIVISNDIDWVRSNFVLKDAEYIEQSMFEEYQDWYDMYIMSKCKHNIIANSSFSWWGAWLNSNPDKIIISPSRFDNIHKRKHLPCNEWVIVEG